MVHGPRAKCQVPSALVHAPEPRLREAAPGIRSYCASENFHARSSTRAGAPRMRATMRCTSAPPVASTSILILRASSMQSLSFIVASKALRRAATGPLTYQGQPIDAGPYRGGEIDLQDLAILVRPGEVCEHARGHDLRLSIILSPLRF